jgi:hypothetical protein
MTLKSFVTEVAAFLVAVAVATAAETAIASYLLDRVPNLTLAWGFGPSF